MVHKVTVNRPKLLKDVKDTKIIFNNRERFDKEIQSFKDGTVLYIDVLEDLPTKTLQQIRYIHLLIGFIAENKGEPFKKAKALLKKAKGLYEDFIDKKTGEIVRVYDSCKDMKLKEAQEFIDYLLYVCEFLNIKVLTIEEYFQI